MKAAVCLCLCAVLQAATDDAPPALSARNVVNAADFSGGGVAPGEIVVLYPSNAGPSQIMSWRLDGHDMAATLVGDTRVLFDDVPAPIYYTVSGQMGAIVPYEIAGKKTTEVVVEYQGRRSPAVTLDVLKSLPALFTLDASGAGQAAMLNESGCCNSVRNPAVRGTLASLYATGEGEVGPHHLVKDVSVTVGGVPAEVVWAGNISLLQVNFRIPENAPVGDAIPLVLTVGGRASSSEVTMAVRAVRQRVQVAEPDAAIRDGLVRMLADAGYEVSADQSTDGADLVMVDLAMGADESLRLVREIREARPAVRVIALGESFAPEALRAADMLGAQAVLTLPLNAEAVLPRVREVLQRRKAVY